MNVCKFIEEWTVSLKKSKSCLHSFILIIIIWNHSFNKEYYQEQEDHPSVNNEDSTTLNGIWNKSD